MQSTDDFQFIMEFSKSHLNMSVQETFDYCDSVVEITSSALEALSDLGQNCKKRDERQAVRQKAVDLTATYLYGLTSLTTGVMEFDKKPDQKELFSAALEHLAEYYENVSEVYEFIIGEPLRPPHSHEPDQIQ